MESNIIITDSIVLLISRLILDVKTFKGLYYI